MRRITAGPDGKPRVIGAVQVVDATQEQSSLDAAALELAREENEALKAELEALKAAKNGDEKPSRGRERKQD